MKERMVPAQQLSDAGEDLVRLAAAKDAEIAALTDGLLQHIDAVAALTKERDGYRRDYEDTRDCLNNERRIWMRINAGGATFAAERDAAKAEIAAITEQRDRAMKALDLNGSWHARHNLDGAIIDLERIPEVEDERVCLRTLRRVRDQIAEVERALDAETAAETASSLPETPEA